MNIYDEIKARITECQRSGESFERDILRTVLGEAQTIASRRADSKTTEADVLAVLKKSKENIVQTMVSVSQSSREPLSREQLDLMQAEIALYNKFLPKYISVEDIVDRLTKDWQDPDNPKKAIETAASDGQATGLAMKYLKTKNVSVQGNDVSTAVKKIRSDAKELAAMVEERIAANKGLQ